MSNGDLFWKEVVQDNLSGSQVDNLQMWMVVNMKWCFCTILTTFIEYNNSFCNKYDLSASEANSFIWTEHVLGLLD